MFLNILQNLFFKTDLHFLEVYIRHVSFFDFSKLVDWMYFFFYYQIGALLYLITFNIIYHILFITLTLGTMLMLVITIKFNQMENYARKFLLTSSTFSSHKFATFTCHNNLSLKFFADVNRIYGKSIFAYMIVNMPLSSLLLMMLLLGKFKGKGVVKACVIVLVIVQFSTIILISFFWAFLSQKLYQLVKRFIRISVCQKLQKTISLTVLMRVATYIEFFHSKNRFALCYGKVGKVTFASCGRVKQIYFKFTKNYIVQFDLQIIFFYCRFIMFAFKLVNNRAYLGQQTSAH